jgi:hypothetical protein
VIKTRPDDTAKPFAVRWNIFVRILLVESSVKLVARTAMDYADFDTGSSCHPSNQRLVRETCLGERTIRTAWGVLRGLGMAERIECAVAYAGQADNYRLVIPETWEAMPILGPHGRKFTCLNCGKLINPQGHSNLGKDGRVRCDVRLFAFCPAPRSGDGPSCAQEWDDGRASAGERDWSRLDSDEIWKLFRLSRGDDW